MSRRNVVAICGAFAAFLVAVALTMITWNGPHPPADYLVVGSLGAFAALATFFASIAKRPPGQVLPQGRRRTERPPQVTKGTKNA